MTCYSQNPFIRFYCGYVEPLCKQYDNTELKNEAERLMHHDISNLTMIDNRLLYQHQSFITRLNDHYYTLRTLRHHEPLIWSYALVRHILLYDMLNDNDRNYIDKWINRLAYPSLIRFYIYHAKNRKYVEELLLKSISRHYYTIETKMSSPISIDKGFPLHRDDSYPDTEIEGLGCYIQAFEGRLTQWYSIKVTSSTGTVYMTDYRDIPKEIGIKVKHKYSDIQPKYSSIPFIEKFSRDTLEPLLKSDIKQIIINIDRKREQSDDTVIYSFIDALYAKYMKLITDTKANNEARLTIIVPDTHLNGCVARNMTYNYIRTAIRNNGLFWFGSDDDDAINTVGVNTLNRYILNELDTSEPAEYKKILLFDPTFSTKDPTGPTTGYKHYATWTYAFSPEYYDALSFPCTPLEKEDLDVFNRLMQHPSNIVNLARIPGYKESFKESPVYIYFGPNPVRQKNHKLYEAMDVIDYMNIHNIYESTDQNLQAPTMSASGPPAWKVFYTNDAERYYCHNPDDRDLYQSSFGLATKTIKDSHNDSVKTIRLNELPIEVTINENLNGDLYIVTYKAILLYKNGRRYSLYGACFQNGKSPYIQPITSLPNRITQIDKHANNYPDIAHEMKHVIGKFDDLFTVSYKPLKANQLSRISRWNSYYISSYGTSKQRIPLRTFGGNNGRRWWLILVWILLSLIIIVIGYRIVKREGLSIVQHSDSID